MDLNINSDIAELLGELDQNELEMLEKNIERDGLRDNIVVAEIGEGGERFILDGVHRYGVCMKLGIDIHDKITVLPLPTIEDAEDWMLDNQEGRRNLTIERRCAIGLRRHEKYAEEGRKRMSQGLDQGSKPWNSYEVVAKKVHVGIRTYKDYCRIAREHPEELPTIHSAEESISGTYNRLYGTSAPEGQAQQADTPAPAANPEEAPELAPGSDATPPSESPAETAEPTSEQANPPAEHPAPEPEPAEAPPEQVPDTKEGKVKPKKAVHRVPKPPETVPITPNPSPEPKTAGVAVTVVEETDTGDAEDVPEIELTGLPDIDDDPDAQPERGNDIPPYTYYPNETALREKYRIPGAILGVVTDNEDGRMGFVVFRNNIGLPRQFIQAELGRLPEEIKKLFSEETTGI